MITQEYSKAEKYEMQGKLRKAVTEYKKNLENDKDNIKIISKLGELYYTLGDIEDSIKYYEKVVKLKPNYSLALYRLGISYYRATEFSKAIEVLLRIIEEESDLYMAHYWIGLAYYHKGNTAKSIENFAAIHDKNPKSTLGYYQGAISLKTAGRFKEAIECLEKISSEDTQVVSVQYHLGLAYLSLKKIPRALKHFNIVLKLQPDHAGAQEKINTLLMDQEMLYAYGIESLQEGDSDEEIINNFHVGQTYKGMAMIEEAFKHFKEKMKKKK